MTTKEGHFGTLASVSSGKYFLVGLGLPANILLQKGTGESK